MEAEANWLDAGESIYAGQPSAAWIKSSRPHRDVRRMLETRLAPRHPRRPHPSRSGEFRRRVIGAWATLVSRGEPTTNYAIGKLLGVDPKAVEFHRSTLVPFYGGGEVDDDCEMSDAEVQARIAKVRASKSMQPDFDGLSAAELELILPD